MSRVVALGVVVAVAAIAWWIHLRTQPTREVPTTTLVNPAPPRRDASAIDAESAGRATPPTALRHVTPAERARIADQIATSRSQRRPDRPVLSDSGQLTSADEVLGQLQAIRADIAVFIETCAPLAPAVTQFKADIVLESDPDVGTLVEADQPVMSGSDAAVPAAFSDCIRGELQTLELPPLQAGESYKVSFEFETADQHH